MIPKFFKKFWVQDFSFLLSEQPFEKNLLGEQIIAQFIFEQKEILTLIKNPMIFQKNVQKLENSQKLLFSKECFWGFVLQN